MATYFIDPNGEGGANSKSDWTPSTGTTSWNLTDDAVRQPTAPTVGTDNVSTSVDGTIDRMEGSTFTLPANEIVTNIKYWAYYEANGGTGCEVRSYVQINGYGSVHTPGAGVITVTGTGWQVANYNSPTGVWDVGGNYLGVVLNQTYIDFLGFERIAKGAALHTVAEEYLEITTSFFNENPANLSVLGRTASSPMRMRASGL